MAWLGVGVHTKVIRSFEGRYPLLFNFVRKWPMECMEERGRWTCRIRLYFGGVSWSMSHVCLLMQDVISHFGRPV